MTKKQSDKLVAMLAAMPGPAWSVETMTLFAEMIADLDAIAAQSAVLHWIRTQRERPSVADIRSACRQQLETAGVIPADPDVDQAWGIVLETIRRSGRYRPFSNDDYPRIKAAVDRMGWEDLCNSENVDVSRAQFERFYRAELSREREARHAAPALQRPDDQVRLAGSERKQVNGAKVLALPDRAAAAGSIRQIRESLTRAFRDMPKASANVAKETPQLREPAEAEKRAADERRAALKAQAQKLAS